MTKKHNPFPKYIKMTVPNKTAKLSIIGTLVITAGIFIFFFTTNDGIISSSELRTTNQKILSEGVTPFVFEEVQKFESKPEFIDLTMVDDDLSITAANLDTIDNLEDL